MGDEAADAIHAHLTGPPTPGVRVHPGRLDLATLAQATGWRLTPLPWTQDAAVLDARGDRPGLHPLHEAGAYYLQDPAATAPAAALDVRPGERVADLAAAPGGKATALGAALRGRGTLLANEVHPERVTTLARNLERFGIANAVVTHAPVADLADRLEGRFDAVLLDAPCSGEGMFAKSDAARRDWSPAAVSACAARQDELLPHAARLLAPGGRLVYATCTFAREENEAVVERLLRARPDLRAAPAGVPGSDPGDVDPAGPLPADAVARLWPHRAPGDGHVLIRLVREGATPTPAPRDLAPPAAARPDAVPPLDREAREAWAAFADATFRDGAWAGAAVVRVDDRLWLDADPALLEALGPLPVLRRGLPLGRLRRGRLEPAHALAMATAGADVRRRVALDVEGAAVRRWLAGEEATLDDVGVTPPEGPDGDGYARVEVLGAPLGWGRISGRRLRNLRPKGLRRTS